MWDVQLFELNYGPEEGEAVSEVIDSGWITMGPKTIKFEQEFEGMLGGGKCVAVSSCTAALHMALLALEVGPGDEVILPALNFIAGANCVRLVGATTGTEEQCQQGRGCNFSQFHSDPACLRSALLYRLYARKIPPVCSH